MSQQINLFNPALRKRRIVLTAARVVMVCALTVIGMVGVWLYEQNMIDGLKGELATAQKLLAAQRSHVERMAAAKKTQASSTSLEGETKKLETEIELMLAQKNMLAAPAVDEAYGFAEYLRAFSRQSLDGLWLTGFDIRSGGDITIRGRTLDPALIPNYLQRLDREKALRGRDFAALELRQPEARTAVSPAPGEKTRQEYPRFLEFSLATAEPAAAPGTAVDGRSP